MDKSTFKAPTVGRIVHFYSVETDHCARQNHAEFIPAMVIQVFPQSGAGDMANLRIFPFGPETDILRGSVHHKDSPEAQGSIPQVAEGAEPGKPTIAYWEWPPIV